MWVGVLKVQAVTHVDLVSYWEDAYQQGSTGWDLGGPTPAFVQFLKAPDAPVPGGMLVPGCGRGYDAILFAQHGFEVIGVDIALSAVAAARQLARGKRVRCTFLQEDLFTLPARYRLAFDYVLEYTCFCAINPARRREYVQAMAAVLRPAGELIGLFFPVLPALSIVEGPGGYVLDGPVLSPVEGPPFPMSEQEIRDLFSPHFDIKHLASTPHTVKPRQGRELLARFRRRQ